MGRISNLKAKDMKKVITKERCRLPKVLVIRWEEIQISKNGRKELRVHSRAV